MSQSAVMQVDVRATKARRPSLNAGGRICESNRQAKVPLAEHSSTTKVDRISIAPRWTIATIPVLSTGGTLNRTLQKKLLVGPSSDPLEREADAIAERVMRDGEKLSIATEATPSTMRAGTVQRQCPACADEDDKAEMLYRSSTGGSPSNMVAPPIVHSVLGNGGSALDTSTRQFMETRFNHDFSQVRVHTDAVAAESARQINARAYTVGNHIVFGQGHYATSTDAGRQLLAHELAHTLQQAHGGAQLQRSETDDSAKHCAGLSDFTPKLNQMVNSRIDEARKAAEAGFEANEETRFAFVKDVRNRLKPLEELVSNAPESHHFTTLDAAASLGKSILNIGPEAVYEPTLEGTKYEGTEALHSWKGLGSVVKIGSICIGADKIGHMFIDGFGAYAGEDGQKIDADAALESSIDAEIGNQGLGNTGVFSRADIAANLAGSEFYEELDANTSMQFDISKYIHEGWNEQENPNFYKADLGEKIFKNTLKANWTGFLQSSNSKKDVDVTLRPNWPKGTVEGVFQEQNVPDGSDPWNQTLAMTGKLSGSLELSTVELVGAQAMATAVEGVVMNLEIDMDSGPDRTGFLVSKNENTLTGEWTEDASGSEPESGTWELKAVGS